MTRSESNAPLVLRFFGNVEIRCRSVPVEAIPRAAVALLTLLVLHRGAAIERSVLAATLWPEADTSRALFYLRRALSTLRAALGPEAARLQIPSGSLLALDLEGAFCDVSAFDAAVERDDPEALERAITLYRRPLLDGWTEPWVLPHRESRARRFVDVLEKRAEIEISAGNLRDAARLLRDALHVEPLRESNHLRLIELLIRLGDSAGAEWQFQNLRRLLRDEANTVPASATVEAYHRLRAGSPVSAISPAAQETRETPVPPIQLHLPVPLTSLFGRTAAINAIAADVDLHRVVTLVGPGGVGKTRLAVAAAEDRANHYPDGVCFVDLATVQSPSAVPQEVRSAVGLHSDSDETTEEILGRHLHLKRYLLLLDNAEHLTESCRALIETILRHCPFVHFLITSHRPLRCIGEHIVSVAPLPLPTLTTAPTAAQLRELSRNDAVALLIERASVNRQPFRLTSRNAAAVAELCRRLDGLPLALEIAAAQLRQLTPQEVITRLDDAFQALSLPRRERALRHRSLRAMVEWSCGRLNPQERTLLLRCSVFAGGWTLEMAEFVCADADSANSADSNGGALSAHAIQAHLDSLVEKSLVSFRRDLTGRGRYRLLETIRVYAAQRLSAADADPCFLRLTDFGIGLADATKQIVAEEPFRIERLGEELPNLRAALAWSTAPEAVEDAKSLRRREGGLTLAARLMRFWWLRGYFTEGREWLAAALTAFPDVEAVNPALAGIAFNAAGVLAVYVQDYESGASFHRRAMEIRRISGDKRGQAVSLHNLGILSGTKGDHSESAEFYQAALDLYRELGHRQGEVSNLLALGVATLNQGDCDTAEGYLEQALAIFREREDRIGCTLACDNLGLVAIQRRRYDNALSYFRYSLETKQALNNDFGILTTLPHIAAALAGTGSFRDSVRLSGAIAANRETLTIATTPLQNESENQQMAEARSILGENASDSAWKEGRALNLAATIEYARHLCKAETIREESPRK